MKNWIKTIIKIIGLILEIFTIAMVLEVAVIHRFQNPDLTETQLFLYMVKTYPYILIADIVAIVIIFLSSNEK